MHDNLALQRLVGDSHWIERTRRRILQASRYSYPVLITGPAGCGKELIARAIHAQSRRCEQPLIPFRCGLLPSELTRLQLFGHSAGAHRLAPHSALGCFGAAQRGTLLLRDVDRLDLETQDRLLSVLRQNRRRREGDQAAFSMDVRVIATTTCDLQAAVSRGQFRLPLLYSINAISVRALPLSDRPVDIAPLARWILARITLEHGIKYRPLTPAALALLESYDWPGNVRELEHELERAVLSRDGNELDLEDFVELFAKVAEMPVDECDARFGSESANDLEKVPLLPTVNGQWPSLQRIEADHLRASLRRSANNIRVAARLLGLSLAELQAKLRHHRIPDPTLATSSLVDRSIR